MSQTPQYLRYTHHDHTRVLRDVRLQKSADITLEQVYFLGFSVWSAHQLHYHHAVISADDYESLTHGITDEIKDIFNRPLALKYRGDITLVFVRNLLMYRQELKDSVSQQKIVFEKQGGHLRRNDNKFMVFGLADNQYVHLVQVETDDALTAIKFGAKKIVTQPDVNFIPLEVSMIHPATQECYSLFDSAAARVKALIEVHSDQAGYRQ